MVYQAPENQSNQQVFGRFAEPIQHDSDYLACAISLVQTEPEYLYQVFKCLYPAVATAFQTSAACVERDIRTLLCAYWRSGGQPLLQAISPRPLTARPTVSELIALLSGYFQDVGDL